MLFTDGLYEVQGPNEELYSQERLMLDVKSRAQKPVAPLFDELLESIRAFSIDHEFEDDVCLVGMEFAGKPAQKKSVAQSLRDKFYHTGFFGAFALVFVEDFFPQPQIFRRRLHVFVHVNVFQRAFQA